MNIKKYILFLFFQTLALQVSSAFCQASELSRNDVTASEQQYQQALVLNRQNKADEALVILENLLDAHSEIDHYLYDYVAIASWSGKHDLALAKSGQIDLNSAPAYVLETIASSQQLKGLLAQSLETYTIAVRRFPDRIDSRIGRVQVLIAQQKFRTAVVELLALQKDYPGQVELWDVAEQLEVSPNQSVNVLSLSQHVLKKYPQNRFALRMRFHALKKLGAVHLAIQQTPETVLSTSERLQAQRGRLVNDFGWADISAGEETNPDRWVEMDAAITGLKSICDAADQSSDPDIARATCGDLVIALVDRKRYPDAIALYESMREKHWVVHSYVTLYVAGAYLEEHQPEVARDLLAAELSTDPGNVDARINYVYALLDSRQYAEAYQQIDQLADETTETGNPDEYVRVHLTAAMIRSYTDRLDEAQIRLESLADRAPFNAEIGRALASTYAMRGWHHRAENEFEKWQAIEPGDVAAHLGLFENRMAINDFRGAQQPLQSATRLLPTNKEVLNSQRADSIHQLRELVVDARFGESNGGGASGATGSHEYSVDTRVYSAPYRDDWRFFGHSQLDVAAYPGVNVERITVGGGAEYRIRDTRVTGELFNMGKNGFGLELGGEYQISDQWAINGQAGINSLAAPVRAYTDNDSANRIQMGGGYRWHESRAVNLSFSHMYFADGNHRRSTDVSWMERLINLPGGKLDATFEYAFSSNSTQSRQINYFNPVNDRYLGVTLQTGWLQFRHKERLLKHDVSISLGQYTQQNFVSGRVMSLLYEITYQLNERLEFRAGIGRTLHPYDGVVDASNFVTGGVNWKF